MSANENPSASIDDAYRAYYDCATEDELHEEFVWAKFAESEFAKLAMLEEPFPEHGSSRIKPIRRRP